MSLPNLSSEKPSCHVSPPILEKPLNPRKQGALAPIEPRHPFDYSSGLDTSDCPARAVSAIINSYRHLQIDLTSSILPPPHWSRFRDRPDFLVPVVPDRSVTHEHDIHARRHYGPPSHRRPLACPEHRAFREPQSRPSRRRDRSIS